MQEKSDKTVAGRASKKIGETVHDATDAATDKAKQKAEAARDMVSDETQTAVAAAHAAADEFDQDTFQARAIEQVASRIDDLAAQIRDTDIDRVARVVGDAVRRNPLMFVAGAAIAGFAATRFLKARDPYRRDHYPGDDPWTGASGGYRTGGYDRTGGYGHDQTSREAM
jgi:hypothetical protein